MPAVLSDSDIALADREPKTLLQACESLAACRRVAAALYGTQHSELAAKIDAIAQAATCGECRVRTLPQAIAKLAEIAALIPAVSVTGPSSPTSAVALKPTAATAATDAALYATYSTLKGAKRMSFFSANREALIRAHAAQSAGDCADKQSDVLTKYQSLTGQARIDFYIANERALWTAYRARNKR